MISHMQCQACNYPYTSVFRSFYVAEQHENQNMRCFVITVIQQTDKNCCMETNNNTLNIWLRYESNVLFYLDIVTNYTCDTYRWQKMSIYKRLRKTASRDKKQTRVHRPLEKVGQISSFHSLCLL